MTSKNIHLLTDWGRDLGSPYTHYSSTSHNFIWRQKRGSDTPTTDHQAHNASYSGLPGPWTFWPWHWPGWVKHMTDITCRKQPLQTLLFLLWLLHPLVIKDVITISCSLCRDAHLPAVCVPKWQCVLWRCWFNRNPPSAQRHHTLLCPL